MRALNAGVDDVAALAVGGRGRCCSPAVLAGRLREILAEALDVVGEKRTRWCLQRRTTLDSLSGQVAHNRNLFYGPVRERPEVGEYLRQLR